ncbi:MAG TPA: translocation/assembly module TamB domain-containing protein [Candidatus Angelobacter sp.]|jgi:translocation and assembly module TamB
MKRKKIILRTGAVLLALVAGLGITAVLLVKHSSSVRRTILVKVERYASEFTGTDVTVHDFSLNLSSFEVRFDGIVARDRNHQSAPPLLQIESLIADIKIDSVLRGQWHLQYLAIHRPVVHIISDYAGAEAMPQPQNDVASNVAQVFDLSVRQCVIDHGEIYFKDTTGPLEAEFNDLRFNVELNHALDRYHGAFGYSQGKIHYGDYAPVIHDLEAGFVLTPANLTVNKLTVSDGPSRLEAAGSVKDFTNPALQATYNAQLSTDDLARVLKKNNSLPQGVVHLAGSMAYQNRGHGPFLQQVSAAGEASSPVLQIKTGAGRGEVRELNAKYTLQSGILEVEDIHARVLGGSANARLTIRDLTGTSRSRIHAQLRDISLEQLEAVAPRYSLPEVHLAGKINADAEAGWGRTLADLVAHMDATLTGTLGLNASDPVNGVVHGDYVAARDEVSLRQSYISTPGVELSLDGKLSSYSQLRVAAYSTNLHQLELLAARLGAAFSQNPLPKLGLDGTASFTGSVFGSLKEARVQGMLEARNLRVKESSWKLLRANVEAGPGALALSNGHLEASPQGTIDFNLKTALQRWAYTPASPVTLAVSISQIPVAEIDWLANYGHQVSGTLSGNIAVHGSQLHPVGRGDISLTGGKIHYEPFQNIAVKFQGDGKAVQANLVAHLPAGTGEAQVEFDPATQQYKTQIRAVNIRLERLQAVRRRNQAIVGALNLKATGQGTISSPQLKGTAEISQLRVGDQSIQGVSLTAGLSGKVAEITLKSEIAQTPFSGHGTVEITAPYMTNLQLDVVRLSFQPLLALYAPSFDGQIHGQAELHASLRGPLQNPGLLEGHLQVPVLTATYEQLQVNAARPLRVDYKNGVLTMQPASLQGTGTNLQMRATIPINNLPAATYLVEGTVDLSLAQMLQPGLTGSGQLKLELDSRKHGAGSEKVGEISLVNASFHTPDTPLGLDNGNGVIAITRSRLEIEKLQAQIGGGAVELRGGITYRPAIRFDLGLSGTDIRLRYPQGVRSLLESNLSLAGNKESATLSGNVTIQNLALTREFDLQSLANHLSEMETSPSPSGFMQQVKLNVNVQSASQMNVASSKVSLSGTANLRLAGTADEPVVLGRASLNGGDFFLAGNRYVLQNGAIDFVNPLRTEAVVNAQIKTKIDQYEITLSLQGPVDRMSTTFTSDPPLPAADITNLLAFGHTSETGGGNPGSIGNLGAQSVLAQGLGGAVSNRVEKFAGLSYFSIDPTLGGSNQNAGARVIIQERVTSNLVVTYSTDVTSTQRQAIQLEYRFSSRWSLSGVRDQNGGFGATASFHKVF